MNKASKPGVLVTGASGYLGSHVTSALLKTGMKVACLTRPGSENKIPQGAEIIRADLSVEAMAARFGELEVESVLHLATQFISEHTPEQIPSLIQSNVEFGTKVAEAACLAGATRFLNIGSFWQHYEGRRYSPSALYAATKQAFETVLAYYSEVRGMSVVNLKFAAVYGPGDTRGKIVDLLIDTLKSGKLLAMSPGEQLVDLIQVDDAVQAVLSGHELLEGLGVGECRSYSVTSGKPLTLKKLAELIGELTGKRPAIQWGVKPYRHREFFSDWVYDERLPGWAPKIPLREGLENQLKGRA